MSEITNNTIEQEALLLDGLRQKDEISAVNFALANIKLWAQRHDQQNGSPEEAHTAIVTALTTNRSRIYGAFTKGRDGKVEYPTVSSLRVNDLVNPLFPAGKYYKLFGTNGSPSIGARMDVLEDHQSTERVLTFGATIMVAHNVYRHLDTKINRPFHRALAEGTNFRIAPGMEEAYWAAKIYGSKQGPGVYQTSGVLARLFTSIREFTDCEYAEDADRYLNAWWAVMSVSKDEKETYKQIMTPMLRPLLAGNIADAEFAIKERLHTNPGSIHYRGRAKFSLTDDEQDFFDELVSSETSEADKNPKTELDKHFDAVEHVKSYVGSLVLMQTINGKLKYGVIRRLAVRPAAPSISSMSRVYPVRYGLKIDYVADDKDGVVVTGGKTSGRVLRAETFLRMVDDGDIEVLDQGEKYADASNKVFELPR